MSPLRKLYARFEQYHGDDASMLVYTARVGALAFPLFYLMRFTRHAAPYDDAWLRGVATLLCLAMAFPDRWPPRWRPGYLPFAYGALVFNLPFFSIYSSLANAGGVVAVSNTLMAAFFLILLTDWRNTLIMLAGGSAAATAAYLVFAPAPVVPAEYLARAPLVMLVILGGSVFKFTEKQAASRKLERSYAALAASIAHEMRNPLGQIEQSFRAMQQTLPLPGVDDARMLGRRELEVLYRELAQGEIAVQRGLRVIAMTLDEVNAKPVEASQFGYVAAAAATRKAVQEYGYENEAERARVQVEVRRDFVFRGDETACLYLLFNLLKNALYYSALRPQGLVRVLVDEGRIRVADDGPGIPPERAAALFEPFEERAGGSGLGLTYCRRVAQAFGGDIAHEPDAGGGAAFVLHLPPAREAELQEHRESVLRKGRAALAGREVVLAGAEGGWRDATAIQLAAMGALVRLRDPAQLSHAAGGIDVVVLDLDLPELQAYAAAQAIRRATTPGMRELPIVGCSSDPAHLARMKAQRADVDELLDKQADPVALVEALLRARCRRSVGASAHDNPLAGRTVVLADDSEWNRKAVAAYLHEAGATVVEAGHGAAVLDHFRGGGACDAVLMDLQMPGIGGLEAARALRRAGPLGQALPILALTGHSDLGVLSAARAAGIDDVIVKPVDPRLLYRKLCFLFGTRASPPAPPPAADPLHEPRATLLDWERLELHRRLGLSSALLAGSIPEIMRLMRALEVAYARSDLHEALRCLHGLLGLSGEAGAALLHRAVQAVYVPMLRQQQWPAGADWLGQLRVLAGRTETALTAYATERANAPTA